MKSTLIILLSVFVLCGCEESPKVNTGDLEYLSKTFNEYRIESTAGSALVIVHTDIGQYYWNSNRIASESTLIRKNSK